jgi:hypothetical protein
MRYYRPFVREKHFSEVFYWLFDPEVMSRTGFDSMDAVEVLHLINLQDWEVCEMTQKSMASRTFEHVGIYTPLEQHIRGLADYILEKLER